MGPEPELRLLADDTFQLAGVRPGDLVLGQKACLQIQLRATPREQQAGASDSLAIGAVVP